MIGYVTLGTNQFENAAAFYDALLGELGATRVMERDTLIAWSADPSKPSVALVKPHNGEAATVGNGMMVSLAAHSKEQVDQLHAMALELGGSDEGKPGPRGPGGEFYCGYFRDLDGNKLNVFSIG